MRKNEFQLHIINLFKKLKNRVFKINIVNKNKNIAYLRSITNDILDNEKEIRLIANWRNKNQYWFPTQFTVTFTGTKKWLKEQLIEKEDRILFFVEPTKLPINVVGHLGLNRFNYKNRSCQIDNVIRGKSIQKGIMTYALQTLICFSFEELNLKYLTLATFADNVKAIALYKRCVFQMNKKSPSEQPGRFNLEMILYK